MHRSLGPPQISDSAELGWGLLRTCIAIKSPAIAAASGPRPILEKQWAGWMGFKLYLSKLHGASGSSLAQETVGVGIGGGGC